MLLACFCFSAECKHRFFEDAGAIVAETAVTKKPEVRLFQASELNLHFALSQRLDLLHFLHYYCCVEIRSIDQEKLIFLLVEDTGMILFLQDKSCCKHASW